MEPATRNPLIQVWSREYVKRECCLKSAASPPDFPVAVRECGSLFRAAATTRQRGIGSWGRRDLLVRRESLRRLRVRSLAIGDYLARFGHGGDTEGADEFKSASLQNTARLTRVVAKLGHVRRVEGLRLAVSLLSLVGVYFYVITECVSAGGVGSCTACSSACALLKLHSHWLVRVSTSRRRARVPLCGLSMSVGTAQHGRLVSQSRSRIRWRLTRAESAKLWMSSFCGSMAGAFS